ncbi:MAG: hypothetical protein DRI57_00210 [Deltaproteobacteria bacterium]|nr:MAG: hypothetical protein DRI57_00210 [Deltaproteobacteria bacterium]
MDLVILVILVNLVILVILVDLVDLVDLVELVLLVSRLVLMSIYRYLLLPIYLGLKPTNLVLLMN